MVGRKTLRNALAQAVFGRNDYIANEAHVYAADRVLAVLVDPVYRPDIERIWAEHDARTT